MAARKKMKNSAGKYPSGVLTRGPVSRVELVPVSDEMAKAIQSDTNIPRLQRILASRGHVIQSNEEMRKHRAEVLLALKRHYYIRSEVGTNEFWRELANSLISHHVPSMRSSKSAGAPKTALLEHLIWLGRVRGEMSLQRSKPNMTKIFRYLAKRFKISGVRKVSGAPKPSPTAIVKGYYVRAVEAYNDLPIALQKDIDEAIERGISSRKNTVRK